MLNGRVTEKDYRNMGLGRELSARGAAFYDARWPARLSARPTQSFYESLGFITVGEPYLEDDIPHIECSELGGRKWLEPIS